MMLALVLSIAVPFAAAPQDDPDAGQGPPLVSLKELELVHYPPENVNVHDLEEVVTRMVGRQLYVKERGGFAGRPVSNVSILGDSLILYDTGEYLQMMNAVIPTLDKPGGTAPKRTPLETLEYTPSYLSLESATHALGSFNRMVSDGYDEYTNISRSRERGLLVVREYPERIAEIRALLERIDVPEPQVRLTCHLIQGVPTQGGDGALPKELLENLHAMVPGYSFDTLSFGVLQFSAVPGREILLKLETGHSWQYSLGFAPVAFDAETGTLSVVECVLQEERLLGKNDAGKVSEHSVIFTTDTVFRGGEYTVLGASGAEPIFVVVRITRM